MKIPHDKEIEITDTGMVIAYVYASDGRRTAIRFFGSTILDFIAPSPGRIERRAAKAHRWADDMIVVCDRQEAIAQRAGETG